MVSYSVELECHCKEKMCWVALLSPLRLILTVSFPPSVLAVTWCFLDTQGGSDYKTLLVFPPFLFASLFLVLLSHHWSGEVLFSVYFVVIKKLDELVEASCEDPPGMIPTLSFWVPLPQGLIFMDYKVWSVEIPCLAYQIDFSTSGHRNRLTK